MTKLYMLVKRFLPIFLLATCSSMVLAQGIAISGRVTASDDGSGAPGVNILIKGTSNGTVTDKDGNYRISAPADAILVFSFVGYTSQELPVSSRTSIDVVLLPDVLTLQEIVITGYGEVKKKDATGAVVNMSNKDFNKGVIASPQDLIVGKFAGVSVTTNSGAPGSGSTIRVRGGSSLSASNDPLIVIDGYPVDNSSPAGVSNPLASLNPNDIETFTVLKDASATAIYGSRASNGVIIVTTKKGKEGKTQFSYNGTVSFSSLIKTMSVQSGDQFRALVGDLNTQNIAGIDAAAIAKLGTSNTDWQKEVFQTGVSQDHNLSASGSIKKLPYRVSYGYTDQQGILKTTSMQRQSLNVNFSPSLLDDHLKLNINAKGSYINNNFGDPGAVGAAVAFDPTQAIYDPAATQYGGYFSWLSKGSLQGPSNPVALLNQTNNQSSSNRIVTNAQAEYKLPFFPDLKVNVNVGFDRTSSDGYNRAPLTAAFTANSTGTLLGRNNTYGGRTQSELTDIYFAYSKQIQDHKIDATAGYGWQHFYREGTNTNSNTAQTTTTTFKNENFLVSFFGRINYSYKGKYLLTTTLRDDGSSRFSKANRWGLFPSLALAWRMKDESFLSGVQFLSDLKLRLGYGVTGQQDVGNQYPYLATYRTSDPRAQYQLGNTFYPTLRPEPYDANIKWESATTYNLGLDFGFLEDKITGSIEVYQKNTSNLLNYVAVANGVNFSNFITTNVGSIESRGLEVTLKATPIQTKDLTWHIGMNFTTYTNKITKLNLTNDPTYIGVFTGGIGVDAFIQNQQVGYPVNSFFTYQQVYNSSGKPQEALYVDRSGLGGVVVGNSLNKYHFNKPNPDFLIGINSRVNYKKFDFSFSGRLSIGNYVYNNVESGRAFYNGAYTLGYFSNIPTYVNDTKFVSQQLYSDFYVQNASFFKMDNLSLGYNLDQVFTQKLKARVSVTMQNAFIITNYKGLDPEVDGGIDNNIYPRPRVVLLGVNLTF